MRHWRQPDSGSTAAIGLAVSSAILAGGIVLAQAWMSAPPPIDPRSSLYDADAGSALKVIIRETGRTAAGSGWATNADLMTRFGLALEGQPNFIDYQKVRALRNGSLVTNTANKAPDYLEVRAALGITEGDFHLRTYPVMPTIGDPSWTKEPSGRLGFVGHIGSLSGSATMTPYANTSGNYLNVSVAIRNDGTGSMVFISEIGVGNVASGAVIKTDQKHTRLLAPGEVQTIVASFPTMAFSPAVTGVNLNLADGYGSVITAPYWIAATSPGGSSVSWTPLLTAGEKYYQSGDPVKFVADHFTGTGERMNSAQPARFVLTGPDGNVWVNTTFDLPKNKPYTYSCANCTVVGNYTATLWDSGVTRKSVDWVHVSALPMFIQAESLAAVSVKEISLLKELVKDFNGIQNTDAYPEGDVFTDASHVRELDDFLSRYSTLIVGSEVRQNSLNSADVKWAIADWVLAGGNLIVLGTYDAQSNWLEPVYHAAQTNANGGISAPDPFHPILVSPERLSYDTYLDRGRAWDIKDDQPFTHVLTRGSGGTSVQDTLAVANPGALGNGTVALTSYMPGSLTAPQDDVEAKRLLHNLLSQSYTMLFIDYGPQIPKGVPVGSAQHLIAVPHPNVPGAVVEAKIVMYVFG